jgi:phosphoserine aminotransferase
MKKHNFGAGPGILPQPVLEQASLAVLDFNGKGLSLLEISHRSSDFQAVMDEAQALVRKIYGLDESWHVLYLQGGASLQFAMLPYNLLPEGGTAAYVNTGTWAKGAIKEARLLGGVNVLASSEDQNFNYIPKGYEVPADAAYLHITTNNTIFGTEYHQLPSSPVPLVADMSSDIFSRPIDINRFGLVYAGAQKNLGPAGATVVLVKDEMLGRSGRAIPTMLDYRTHVEKGSMYNTPPVFAVYVCMLTLRWIEEQGGLSAMEARNRAKAESIYKIIDENPLFRGTAAREDRSLMNVTFVAENPEHEAPFLKLAGERGMVGLKGHRSVGGFRASIYNALPLESVEALCALMQEFAAVHA